jgi:hypothetical protein
MSRKLDQTNSWPPAVKELDSASTTLKEIRERGNPLSNSYDAILNIPDNERRTRDSKQETLTYTQTTKGTHTNNNNCGKKRAHVKATGRRKEGNGERENPPVRA